MTPATRETLQQAAVLLHPRGPLDVESCGALRQQLAAAFQAGVTSVAVDLRDVPSAETEGLHVLAGAARYLRAHGGQLLVSRACPEVARALRVNGLGALLEVQPSPTLDSVPAGRRLALVKDAG